MRKFDGYIFDIDGTLLFIRGAGMQAIQKTLKKVFHVPEIHTHIRPDGKTDPEIFTMIMEENGIPANYFESRKHEILGLYFKFMKKIANSAGISPGTTHGAIRLP